MALLQLSMIVSRVGGLGCVMEMVISNIVLLFKVCLILQSSLNVNPTAYSIPSASSSTSIFESNLQLLNDFSGNVYLASHILKKRIKE